MTAGMPGKSRLRWFSLSWKDLLFIPDEWLDMKLRHQSWLTSTTAAWINNFVTQAMRVVSLNPWKSNNTQNMKHLFCASIQLLFQKSYPPMKLNAFRAKNMKDPIQQHHPPVHVVQSRSEELGVKPAWRVQFVRNQTLQDLDLTNSHYYFNESHWGSAHPLHYARVNSVRVLCSVITKLVKDNFQTSVLCVCELPSCVCASRKTTNFAYICFRDPNEQTTAYVWTEPSKLRCETKVLDRNEPATILNEPSTNSRLGKTIRGAWFYNKTLFEWIHK